MIVLDTHCLIWWVTGSNELLSSAARKAINTAHKDQSILVSAISLWEIAMLIDKGRLTLTMDIGAWITAIKSINSIEIQPIDVDIAIKSVTLPGEFHKDPADRMIVTTAREANAALVSADEKIRNYRHVKSIW